jgi:hypothetical protein
VRGEPAASNRGENELTAGTSTSSGNGVYTYGNSSLFLTNSSNSDRYGVSLKAQAKRNSAAEDLKKPSFAGN